MVAAPGMRSLVGETWPAHRWPFRFKKHSESRKLRKAVACASRYFSHLSFNYYFFPPIFISSLLGIRRKASYELVNQSIKFRCVLKLTQKGLNILGNYCLESDQQFLVIQHPAGMVPLLFLSSPPLVFQSSGVFSSRLRPRPLSRLRPRKASYGLANQSIKFRCVLKLTQKVLNILGNYCLESDLQFSVIQHPAGMVPFLFSSSHESSKFHPSGVSSLRLRPRHCLAA